MSTTTSTSKKAWLEGSLLSAGVLLTAALILFANYFGARYYERFDWTKTQIYSLSEKSTNIARTLGKDIQVSILTSPGAPLSDEVKELLARYQALSSRIKVRTLDPVKNLAEAQRLLEAAGTRYQQGSVKVIFDDGKEHRIFDDQQLAEYDYSAVQMGGAPTITAFKGEEAFTSALVDLTAGKKPKVLFVTGHGEKNPKDFNSRFQGLSQLLARNNVEIDAWASLGQAAVPAGTDLLVIAGPTASFVPPELQAFSAYLGQGGRMLLLLDPPISPAGKVEDLGLTAWLAGYGVKIAPDVAVDPAKTVPFFGPETFALSSYGDHPVTKALSEVDLSVIVSLARSVGKGSEIAGTTVTELVKSGSEGWGETDLAAPAKKDPVDTQGPVSLGVAVEKEKMRLVAFGDSNFAGDDLLPSNGNAAFLDNAFNWLLARENLLGIPPKKPEQARLDLGGDGLSRIFIAIALLPVAAVAAGVAVYLKRRR